MLLLGSTPKYSNTEPISERNECGHRGPPIGGASVSPKECSNLTGSTSQSQGPRNPNPRKGLAAGLEWGRSRFEGGCTFRVCVPPLTNQSPMDFLKRL